MIVHGVPTSHAGPNVSHIYGNSNTSNFSQQSRTPPATPSLLTSSSAHMLPVQPFVPPHSGRESVSSYSSTIGVAHAYPNLQSAEVGSSAINMYSTLQSSSTQPSAWQSSAPNTVESAIFDPHNTFLPHGNMYMDSHHAVQNFSMSQTPFPHVSGQSASNSLPPSRGSDIERQNCENHSLRPASVFFLFRSLSS